MADCTASGALLAISVARNSALHRGSLEAGYHLFDVLWLDGENLTARTLDERRARLCKLPLSPPLYRVERLSGERPWERACAEGWEGVIAKRRDSAYEHRRSRNWLKMKCEAGQELVVGGFSEPSGSRAGRQNWEKNCQIGAAELGAGV